MDEHADTLPKPGANAKSRPFQIMSFDGGGLKGLFAAAILAEVEK